MDLATLDAVVAAFKSHSWLVLAWLALSIVVTTVFRLFPDSAIVAFVARYRVGMAFLALCKRFGIDPFGLLKDARAWADRNPPTKPSDGAGPGPGAVVIALVVLLPSLGGCAWWQKHDREVIHAADVACIMAYAALDNDAIEQICKIEHEFAPLIGTYADPERVRTGAARLEGYSAGVKTAGACR